MTKQVNEEYIRVAAYYLWENAGRPDGREQEFWQLACAQVCGPKPASKKSSSKKVAAKPASVKPAAQKAAAKPIAKKTSAKPAFVVKPAVKPAAKPAVVAKPFYGIKK